MLSFDSTTQAELAACTNKIAYGNALIAALGANRLVTYKRAASGDAWATGTTFYAGTLTGTMVVTGGKVQTFGATGNVTTKLSADLSTGVSVVRVSNTAGTRWMQGSLGLVGSGADFKLRKSPSGAYGIGHVATKTTAPATLPSAPDLELTTLVLRNTTGVTQSANFIAPFFGQTFKQGDIPIDTYPHFRTAGGNACPATLHSFTTWPDGSMKFCGVMMRVPESIAGSGSLTISVRSGGNAPAAGTRATSELTSADIKAELTVVDPADGLYTTSVNDGLTVADDVALYANGPAGAIWRIGAFARDSGGTAHGQIYCWHYVAAMTNSSGGLHGLRYVGRIAQPWGDTTSPAPRHRDIQAVLKRGSTTIRSFLGHLDSETPGATFRLTQHGSFMTADLDGKWDFIQAGGTASAESTVQAVPNLDYAIEAGVLPPFVRNGAPTNTLVDHYPFGRGQLLRYMPNTGGRSDLGLMTGWDVKYMSNQSLQNERAIRVHGMLTAGWRIAYRNKTTRKIIPVSAVRASYAGLGTIQSNWRIYGSNNGYVNATPNASLWVEDTAHRPNTLLLPYVLTGEPQFMDIMYDNGAAQQGGLAPGILTINNETATIPEAIRKPWVGERDNRVGPGGTVRVGGGFAFIAGRTGAWPTRDIGVVAAMTPDVTVGGTGETQYFKDIIDSIHTSLTDYITLMPASHVADGIWGVYDSGPESPWQNTFWNHTMCWQSTVFNTTKAINFRKYLLRRFVRAMQLYDAGNLIAYRQNQFNEDKFLAQTMGDMVWSTHRELTFDTTTNRMTVVPMAVGSNELGPFTLTNGDVFAFTSDLEHQYPKPFPAYGWNKKFYAINVVGNTCQLSATKGGTTPLAMTVPGSVTTFYAQLQNMELASGFSPDYEYTMQIRGLLAYHHRLGDPDAAWARSVFDPKATARNVLATDVGQFSFQGV